MNRNRKSPGSQIDQSSPFKKEIKPGVIYTSNVSPNVSKLGSVLGSGPSDSAASLETDERRVDVSLRTPFSSAPSILLLFNVPTTERNKNNKPETTTTGSVLSKSKPVTITIEIGLGGRIKITSITGLWGTTSSSDDKIPTDDEAKKVRSTLAKVLERSDDMGMLVEWVIRWVRRHDNNTS